MWSWDWVHEGQFTFKFLFNKAKEKGGGGDFNCIHTSCQIDCLLKRRLTIWVNFHFFHIGHSNSECHSNWTELGQFKLIRIAWSTKGGPQGGQQKSPAWKIPCKHSAYHHFSNVILIIFFPSYFCIGWKLNALMVHFYLFSFLIFDLLIWYIFSLIWNHWVCS